MRKYLFKQNEDMFELGRHVNGRLMDRSTINKLVKKLFTNDEYV